MHAKALCLLPLVRYLVALPNFRQQDPINVYKMYMLKILPPPHELTCCDTLVLTVGLCKQGVTCIQVV